MFREFFEELGEGDRLLDEGTETEETPQFLAVVTHTKPP